ncbi:MAG TPA: porin [Candidatus Acidoferrales bacterium]|nr:porin [Candidatus Acidoferrales bacterium]
MKLNQLILTAIVGAQFALPLFAADSEATNSTGAAQSESPALTAGGTAASAAETEEIEDLKREIQALDQKVQNLEKQHQSQQQAIIATNQEQIQELDQKVRVLSRQHELDQETAEAAAKLQPRFKLDSSGFLFTSADTNFSIGLHGLVQLDSRTYLGNNNVANSGFLLRRARPIIVGTVFHDFDYNLTPDFGGGTVQIVDAYINYHYDPQLQLEAGKFKPPVGLEALQSDANLYLNERSLVTDLVPNRDVGLELHGDLFGGAISYAAAIMDGAPDYSSTTVNTNLDSDLAYYGRIFVQPWITSDVDLLRGLGFGVGGSYEDASGVNGLTAGYTTDGQQRFFTYTPAAGTTIANGQHWRLSPQSYYYYGPLGLMGEYAISDQNVRNGAATANLQNTAWEVQGGWVLTGEDASYNGVTPRHPFKPLSGGWGAWQVVGRYEQLNVDSAAFPTFASSAASASAARAWSAGLNWYLNRNIRFDASYSHTTFSGYTGPSPAVPAKGEDVFFTRIQLAF